MRGLARELLSSRFFPYFYSSFSGFQPDRISHPNNHADLETLQDFRFQKLFIACFQQLKKLFEISITIDLANLHLSCFCLAVKPYQTKHFDFIGFDCHSIAGKIDRFAPCFLKEQNFYVTTIL